MRAVVLVRDHSSKALMRSIVVGNQCCSGRAQWSILPLRACDAERMHSQHPSHPGLERRRENGYKQRCRGMNEGSGSAVSPATGPKADPPSDCQLDASTLPEHTLETALHSLRALQSQYNCISQPLTTSVPQAQQK